MQSLHRVHVRGYSYSLCFKGFVHSNGKKGTFDLLQYLAVQKVCVIFAQILRFHRFLWFLWEHHVFFREHVPRTSEKSKKTSHTVLRRHSLDWNESPNESDLHSWSNKTLSYLHCWMLCAWISHFNECQVTYLHKQDVLASPVTEINMLSVFCKDLCKL